MQKNNMSFLKNLTTVADARTARASSWDQSGRNKDYWLVNAGDTAVMADIEGPGVIQHIWITVDSKTSEGDCFVLRDLIMRMYWDGEENPSVEVPLGDFFCCGFGQECIVNSAIITVVPSRGLNSYFAMPFHKHARITIENQHKNPIPAFLSD